MDCYLIITLIILLTLLLIGLYMLLDCLGDQSFNMSRRASAIGGDGLQVYSKFSAGEDVESGPGPGQGPVKCVPAKHPSFCSPTTAHCGTNHRKDDSMGPGAGTIALLVSTLHRGSQSYHSQGLCNVGGGNWSNGPSVWASGRPSGSNTWAPVSGGAFDACQCEDSGGLF